MAIFQGRKMTLNFILTDENLCALCVWLIHNAAYRVTWISELKTMIYFGRSELHKNIRLSEF